MGGRDGEVVPGEFRFLFFARMGSMLRPWVLLILATAIIALLIRITNQIVNRDGWRRIRRTVIWLPLPLLILGYFSVFPINPYPFCRFDEGMLTSLRRGMTLAEVEAILGVPAGHYGNPEFHAASSTMEGRLWPPGCRILSWSDDQFLLEVGFDANGHVLMWHRRAGHSRQFESPLSRLWQ
jgi:hypothetical protein